MPKIACAVIFEVDNARVLSKCVISVDTQNGTTDLYINKGLGSERLAYHVATLRHNNCDIVVANRYTGRLERIGAYRRRQQRALFPRRIDAR